MSAVLAAVDNGKNIVFKGSVLDPMLPRTIVRVKRALALRYTANPSDPTIRGVAEYLLQLCGPYASRAEIILNNLGGSLPVITGPSNQSVLVGGNAVFSVSVVSSTNVTYQWYANGILIPGAISNSYTITNAQISQSGNTYFVTATNASGSVTSNTVTLTVTASLLAYFYQGSTDYSASLLAGIDNVPYSGSTPITTGQPITITFPNPGQTNPIVMKYPATEPTKTSYLNPPPSGPDGGPIPNIALEGTTFGGWSYVFSRGGNPFGLNNVNGEVKFS